MKHRMRIGVMEADIGASLTRQGVGAFETKVLNLLILERVGKLVCPAEFDTGAFVNVALLSVPEGADKPLKSLLMF